MKGKGGEAFAEHATNNPRQPVASAAAE